MAHDEDILREASALVNRAQLQLSWVDGPVYIGFRRSGALSLFLGADEVYQFDTDCRWRRGFYADRLLKAEQGRLVELDRQRGPEATVLVRTELDEDQQRSHLQRLEERLQKLAADLDADRLQVVGQVTIDVETDVVSQLKSWLAARPQPIQVADTARHR